MPVEISKWTVLVLVRHDVREMGQLISLLKTRYYGHGLCRITEYLSGFFTVLLVSTRYLFCWCISTGSEVFSLLVKIFLTRSVHAHLIMPRDLWSVIPRKQLSLQQFPWVRIATK